MSTPVGVATSTAIAITMVAAMTIAVSLMAADKPAFVSSLVFFGDFSQ
jgi:hypothetical protein